jgi:hypothetical protein
MIKSGLTSGNVCQIGSHSPGVDPAEKAGAPVLAPIGSQVAA